MMSLLMLASMGMVPVSQLLAGFLIRLSFSVVIAIAGAGMAVLSLLALSLPSVRAVGLRTGLLGEELEAGGSPVAATDALPGGAVD